MLKLFSRRFKAESAIPISYNEPNYYSNMELIIYLPLKWTIHYYYMFTYTVFCFVFFYVVKVFVQTQADGFDEKTSRPWQMTINCWQISPSWLALIQLLGVDWCVFRSPSLVLLINGLQECYSIHWALVWRENKIPRASAPGVFSIILHNLRGRDDIFTVI